MKFGLCGAPKTAAIAAQSSYDFAEWSVGALLKPQEPQQAFEDTLKIVQKADLPYPVLNCFIPGDLKITGPNVDIPQLKKYVTTTFQRAQQARVEIIVFGSGGARNIPDNFNRTNAHDQLLTFCSMFTPIAQSHNVTVVVEPLNLQETNHLNTVSESAALVREVNHPNLRLLVDAYHFLKDNDSFDDIVANADLLSHVHIATIPNRLAPDAEPCDFAPFFYALAKSNYDSRVSIEANITDPQIDLPKAISLMQSLSLS